MITPVIRIERFFLVFFFGLLFRVSVICIRESLFPVLLPLTFLAREIPSRDEKGGGGGVVLRYACRS